MNLWCILLLYVVINNRLTYTLKLNNYISDYRLSKTRITPITESGSLSNAKTRINTKMPSPSIRLSFSAFGEEFDFILTKEEVYEPIMLKIIGYVNSTIKNWTPVFYEKLSDDHQPITAFGYVHNNVFVGCLVSQNATYFLEHASWYFSDPNKSSTAVIYRSMDIVFPFNSVTGAENSTLTGSKFIPPRTSPKHFRKVSSKKELMCKLELFGDYTMTRFIEEGDMSASFLYYHVKIADYIFRATNFGVPPVRITAQFFHISVRPSDSDESSDSPITARNFLYQCSHKAQEPVCISFCICDRKFSDGIIGASFRASENNSFGICQTKTMEIENKSLHVNTGVMTVRSGDSQRIPFAISAEVFLHQLGHLFGSEYDPPNDSNCLFDDHGDYFIMNEMVNEVRGNITHNVRFFSPCSIANMSLIIQERLECLDTTFMFCGNGVREGTEECDCGDNERVCEFLDPCCTPRGLHGTDHECTFRRSAGSVCSPMENNCCNYNCSLANQIRCYYDDEHCLISFCDGVSKECPDPSPSADGTPCMSFSGICLNGTCNSTICGYKKLLDCICEEEKYSCQVCCELLGTEECVPAWTLGIYAPDGTKYIRQPNSPCRSIHNAFKNEKYRCDDSGVCTSTKRLQFHEIRFNWVILLAVMVAIIFILIFISGFILFLHSAKSSVMPASSTDPP